MLKEFHKVATVNDLSPGEMIAVEAEDESILLVNKDGNFYAIGEVCTHQGGLLSEGMLEGDEVECPLHGAAFNIETGEPTLPPAVEGVPVYSVRLEGDDILVGPGTE